MKIEQQSDNGVIKFNITIEDSDNNYDAYFEINKILGLKQESEDNQKISITFNVPEKYDSLWMSQLIDLIKGREYEIHFNVNRNNILDGYSVINALDMTGCPEDLAVPAVPAAPKDRNQNDPGNAAMAAYISELNNSTNNTVSQNVENDNDLIFAPEYEGFNSQE